MGPRQSICLWAGTLLLGGAAGAAFAGERDPVNHYILACPDGCPQKAFETPIGAPAGIAVDGDGNVYFTSQHIAFKLRTDGVLVRIAGTGEPGLSGDGGPALAARLNLPSQYPDFYNDLVSDEYASVAGGIAVDADGSLVIADNVNHRVRRVDPAGNISTLRDGNGEVVGVTYAQGVAFDGDGGLVISSLFGDVVRWTPDGSVEGVVSRDCFDSADSPVNCGANQIAVDPAGGIVFADGLCRIRRWDPVDGVETIGGGGHDPDEFPKCGRKGEGGPAVDALFMAVFGVSVDADGQVYFTDLTHHCVRRIGVDGVVTTVVGTCARVFSDPWWAALDVPFRGDGGPASEAQLWSPRGVAVDREGNLFIADTGHRRIRKVTPDGIITTIAGNGEALPIVKAGELASPR